jgi:hypothetical protein
VIAGAVSSCMIIKSSWIATFELSLICSHLQASSSSSRSSCMHVIQPQIRAERRQMHMQRFSKYKAKLQAASASVTHLYSNVSNLVNLSSATIIRMRCSQEVHQIPGKTRSWVDTDCKLITLDSSRGVPHTLQPYSYVRLVATSFALASRAAIHFLPFWCAVGWLCSCSCGTLVLHCSFVF